METKVMLLKVCASYLRLSKRFILSMGYFYFTKKERRALLICAFLVFIALLVPAVWKGEPLVLELFLNDKEEEIVQRITGGEKPDQNKKGSGSEEYIQADSDMEVRDSLENPATPEMFDPNTADRTSMVQAGMPLRVAQTIINYREKGGKFYRKADLKKIYVMTDSIYERIEPYVRIPEEGQPAKQEKAIMVDINLADEETWKLLPGIGSAYAARICRYRSSLGGFNAIQQVAETFGLPDTVFVRIKPRLVLSPVIHKLQINSLPVDSLARHPYINYKQAGIVVNYRKHHPPFLTLQDLEATKAFTTAELQRLEPYINFSDSD